MHTASARQGQWSTGKSARVISILLIECWWKCQEDKLIPVGVLSAGWREAKAVEQKIDSTRKNNRSVMDDTESMCIRVLHLQVMSNKTSLP